MDANQTCEDILKYIKLSNLNFNIVESPFSATITLKKTFIENKDGTSRLSGITISPQQVFIASSKPNHHNVTHTLLIPPWSRQWENNHPIVTRTVLYHIYQTHKF